VVGARRDGAQLPVAREPHRSNLGGLELEDLRRFLFLLRLLLGAAIGPERRPADAGGDDEQRERGDERACRLFHGVQRALRVCQTMSPATSKEKGSTSTAKSVIVCFWSAVRKRWLLPRVRGRMEIFASSCATPLSEFIAPSR